MFRYHGFTVQMDEEKQIYHAVCPTCGERLEAFNSSRDIHICVNAHRKMHRKGEK